MEEELGRIDHEVQLHLHAAELSSALGDRFADTYTTTEEKAVPRPVERTRVGRWQVDSTPRSEETSGECRRIEIGVGNDRVTTDDREVSGILEVRLGDLSSDVENAFVIEPPDSGILQTSDLPDIHRCLCRFRLRWTDCSQ